MDEIYAWHQQVIDLTFFSSVDNYCDKAFVKKVGSYVIRHSSLGHFGVFSSNSP